MVHRKYAALYLGAARFSPATTKALELSLGRALSGRRATQLPLRAARYAAARELTAQGFDTAQAEFTLGAMVEDAGRTYGADRPSLLSREPAWMAVREQVLDA